jgi:predicted O-methyltransferase YrrM
MDFEQIIIRGNRRLSKNDCELLYNSSKEINAQKILEIGSADGTSSMVFSNVCKETGGHLWCIEPRPKARWYENMKMFELEQYATMVAGFSPWIKEELIPETIDFLLIDGEHRATNAIVDFFYWTRRVRNGGRMAFHDIYGPVANKVWHGINTLITDYGHHFKEVGRCPVSADRGVIVFEKTVEGLL